MKNYIIGSLNSAGIMTQYVCDPDNRDSLITVYDIQVAKDHLEHLNDLFEGYYSDYKVIELVPVE